MSSLNWYFLLSSNNLIGHTLYYVAVVLLSNNVQTMNGVVLCLSQATALVCGGVCLLAIKSKLIFRFQGIAYHLNII